MPLAHGLRHEHRGKGLATLLSEEAAVGILFRLGRADVGPGLGRVVAEGRRDDHAVLRPIAEADLAPVVDGPISPREWIDSPTLRTLARLAETLRVGPGDLLA
jgi:hypothetical protein